jgi:hypothetical protein
LAEAHGNHPPGCWEDLLGLIDAELKELHTLVIIGDAASGLRSNRAHLTTDVDSVTSTRGRRPWAAIERARRKMKEKPLRLFTLMKRLDEARRVRVGDPRRFKRNFLSLVSTLSGDEAADRVEPRLKNSGWAGHEALRESASTR